MPAHLKNHIADKLNIAVAYPYTYFDMLYEKDERSDYSGDFDDGLFNIDKFWEIEAKPRVYQADSYDYLEKARKEEEKEAQLKLSKSRFPRKCKK